MKKNLQMLTLSNVSKVNNKHVINKQLTGTYKFYKITLYLRVHL